MLSADTLAKLLPSKKLRHSLFVFEELESTNSFALQLAKTPTPQGTVILADRQTSGRGRLERKWHSPPGVNIYGSVLFSFQKAFQALGWIPLMAGVAIAEAIEKITNIRINLKWPNDLLIMDRKLGGILCESFKRNSRESCVVIGFGINVNLTQSAIPEDLKPIATSLSIHAQRKVDRHHLIQAIIQTLEGKWERLCTQGQTACQTSYSERCNTLGKQVVVQYPDGRKLEGLAQAIGDNGQLQIQPKPYGDTKQSGRIVEVHAGDIRHIN